MYVIIDGRGTIQLEDPIQPVEVQSPAGNVRTNHRRPFGGRIKLMKALQTFALLKVPPKSGEVQARPKMGECFCDETRLKLF